MSELDSLSPLHRVVAVLAGGTSAERDVSLRSGAAVAAALRSGGHTVVELDPARDELHCIDWARLTTGQTGPKLAAIDCVFIALHGAFGEDGQVQMLLESQGVPYTGSDATASALAFSKWESKQRFLACGVPTAPAIRITSADSAAFAHSAAATLGFPVVVKPDRQGSSIGITFVSSSAELPSALEAGFRFDSVLVLESALPGDEWTIAVIDGESLPPIRIGTPRQFYDYTAKYAANDTKYLFEDSPTPLTQPLRDLGLAACRALGCAGVARVDVRLDAVGTPQVLEVNTIPGMTDHSLVPKAAARVAMSMTALCERAIDSAMAIHHARKRSRVLPGPASTPLHRRAG